MTSDYVSYNIMYVSTCDLEIWHLACKSVSILDLQTFCLYLSKALCINYVHKNSECTDCLTHEGYGQTKTRNKILILLCDAFMNWLKHLSLCVEFITVLQHYAVKYKNWLFSSDFFFLHLVFIWFFYFQNLIANTLYFTLLFTSHFLVSMKTKTQLIWNVFEKDTEYNSLMAFKYKQVLNSGPSEQHILLRKLLHVHNIEKNQFMYW